MTTTTIVVIGKKSVRKTEVAHLETFGTALALRAKQLVTTKGEGVPSIIAKAYAKAGGTPVFMTSADYADYTENHPVIVFTDTKYVEQLDKIAPDWRARDWCVIHNPKATEEAAAFLVQMLSDYGTPIEASA